LDSLDQTAEEMERLGYETIGAIYGFGPNGDGEAAYFDTKEKLGIVVELAKGLRKNKLAFWRPNLGQIWPLLIEQNRRNSIDYFEDFAIEELVKPALDSDRGMP